MARIGDFSESPPRMEDHQNRSGENMGPVSNIDRYDGEITVSVKAGDDMYDITGADGGEGGAQEFVQVENTAGMIRLPKQQAVLRGDSIPPAKQVDGEQAQMKAQAKASRMAVERQLMQGVEAQEASVGKSAANVEQVEGQEQFGTAVQSAGELPDELAAAQFRAARLEQDGH